MTKKAFRKNTFMFRNNIALLTEIADRLLSSGDLIEDDAVLVRQKQKDLRELVAAIFKRHEKGLGPFPLNPPGVGYHGCSHLMNIAAVLFGLGYQFESTRELIKEKLGKSRATHARNARAKLDANKNAERYKAIDAACNKLPKINPSERGAAKKIHKRLPLDIKPKSPRTVNRWLEKKPR